MERKSNFYRRELFQYFLILFHVYDERTQFCFRAVRHYFFVIGRLIGNLCSVLLFSSVKPLTRVVAPAIPTFSLSF